MVSVTVELRNVEGTRAALGWAGGHTIVVDRPQGRAGGQGLGFNGAQLLGLAIGGCFCNDLHFVAAEMGVELTKISISVRVELESDLSFTKAATVTVSCETSDGSDPQPVIAEAKARCMVHNSLRRGVPVTVEAVA
ncbi:OsmC family protein [Rhizobium jaguaris]|uniref:OsmC family peroxiredoxin n=1 Tax=Rhizobium jaguaris TaxID=1312183 RepID=A0A387FVH8_9HYPH|nr:OsmC family protein [Rhizobium jaguaris]AYG59871.1 OsmC family peroxiredoxin [Rhizobium jaguaris]